jgi:hypothetical protein
VVLRKQVTERTEKVRETVRRDVVDVEHAREAVPVLAYEVEGGDEVRPAHHEAEIEDRVQTRQEASNGKGQHDEPQDNKRQHDELHDKKAGLGPQGPAPQPGVRKN